MVENVKSPRQATEQEPTAKLDRAIFPASAEGLQDRQIAQVPQESQAPQETQDPQGPEAPEGTKGVLALQGQEAQLPPLELLSDLADLYKMFGDSTRLQILSALRMGELCVGDLADLLNMSASAISHQLRTLRAQNLVTYRREGKMSYYSLADEHVEIIIDMGLEHIQEE